MSDRGRGRGRGRGDGGGYRGDRGGGRGGGGGGGRGRGGPRQPVQHTVYSSPEGVPQPDQNVARAEDKFQVARTQAQGMPDFSGLNLNSKTPVRPAYGTKGAPVVLWTNYFQLKPNDKLVMYRYSIDITSGPRELPKGKKRRVIQLMLEQGNLPFDRKKIVTDFATNLVSSVKFNDWESEEFPFMKEFEDEPRAEPEMFKLSVRFNAALSIADLIAYVTSTSVDFNFLQKEEVIQALNIFLGHSAKARENISVPRSAKSFPVEPINPPPHELGPGLKAIRGFFSSIRLATSRILVNVNVTFGAFHSHDLVSRLWDERLSRRGIHSAEKFLKRLRADAIHMSVKKGKPSVKVIEGLARKSDGKNGKGQPPKIKRDGAGPQEVEFFLKSKKKSDPKSTGGKKGKKPTPGGGEASEVEGEWITVFQYFKREYKINLQPNYPVVNVGSRQSPIYMPMELLKIMPGQAYNAKLSPNETREMIEAAVRRPYVNAPDTVSSSAAIVGLNSAIFPQMDTWGIAVQLKLLTVPGRVLPAPVLKYSQGKGPLNVVPRFGSWNLSNASLFKPARVGNWAVLHVNFGDVPGGGAARPLGGEWVEAVQEFQRILGNSGLQMQRPSRAEAIMIPQRDGGPPHPVLENWLKSLVINVPENQKIKFVLFILPASDTTLYNQIKNMCDRQAGVHSLCSVAKNFRKRSADTYMNLGLKINLKHGGINHMIDPNQLPVVGKGKTMVVGIDVTHPSPGSTDKAPSVAGLVASLDRDLAHWPAEIRIQGERRQEMVSALQQMLKNRLLHWRAIHKELPQNILVYRDGVSEGQYNLVLEKELPLLRAACGELYTQQPKITIVIVGKRHHTRFYPTKPNEIDTRSGNPQNGTVVDRGVTEARNWDFFLQAHASGQGTARPAHYFIVHDEIFRTFDYRAANFANLADVLEHLTHQMCYLYGRATKAVSLCPPAYYADLVCERARRYLASYFDPSSDDGASVASSEAAAQTEATDGSVSIHRNLAGSMFYV